MHKSSTVHCWNTSSKCSIYCSFSMWQEEVRGFCCALGTAIGSGVLLWCTRELFLLLIMTERDKLVRKVNEAWLAKPDRTRVLSQVRMVPTFSSANSNHEACHHLLTYLVTCLYLSFIVFQIISCFGHQYCVLSMRLSAVHVGAEALQLYEMQLYEITCWLVTQCLYERLTFLCDHV